MSGAGPQGFPAPIPGATRVPCHPLAPSLNKETPVGSEPTLPSLCPGVPSIIPPKSTYSSAIFPGSSLGAFLANISLWGREKELPQGKESRSTTATRVKKRVGPEAPLCGRPGSAWNLPCLPWVQQYQLLPSHPACPAILGGPEPQGGQLGQRHPG